MNELGAGPARSRGHRPLLRLVKRRQVDERPDRDELAVRTRLYGRRGPNVLVWRGRRCTNPRHDHIEPEGTEVPLATAPASARRMDDLVAVLTEPRPARCHDCDAPIHYDLVDHEWRHDDPAVQCFLNGGGEPRDAERRCRP